MPTGTVIGAPYVSYGMLLGQSACRTDDVWLKVMDVELGIDRAGAEAAEICFAFSGLRQILGVRAWRIPAFWRMADAFEEVVVLGGAVGA